MYSVQKQCANWLIRHAPGRSAPGSPRTYHARIPWQQTTSHLTGALRCRADINDKAFPRNLYTMECHNITGLSLSINGLPLSQIGNAYGEKITKFLGIYIDEFLTWHHHLTHINNKISRALFMIRQTKHFLPVASLRTLYFAMIHPHISYGILAWGNAT